MDEDFRSADEVAAALEKLPLEERLERMGELIVRAKIFYDIWYFYEGSTRSKILDSMNEYPSFFRFDPHAHFVSFVVTMAALLEKKHNTINIFSVSQELHTSKLISQKKLNGVLNQLSKVSRTTKGLKILRNNLFGHRSAHISYSDVFKLAALKPNDFQKLMETLLKAANVLLKSQGLNERIFTSLPLNDCRNLLKKIDPKAT